MTWTKFEQIEAWILARELSKQVYNLTFGERFSKDFSLTNQIRASSGSVMGNIAEGFERGGNKEFIQFLTIAKGSNGEVHSQLYRALDLGYVSEENFRQTFELSEKTGSRIYTLITYLRQSEMKGNRYK